MPPNGKEPAAEPAGPSAPDPAAPAPAPVIVGVAAVAAGATTGAAPGGGGAGCWKMATVVPVRCTSMGVTVKCIWVTLQRPWGKAGVQ